MEGSSIEHQAKSRAHARSLQPGHVATNELDLHARLNRPHASALKRPLDDVHTDDLPASPGQLDPPDTAPGPKIERSTVGPVPGLLLARKQLRELRAESRLILGVLPRMEPHSVRKLIVH